MLRLLRGVAVLPFHFHGASVLSTSSTLRFLASREQYTLVVSLPPPSWLQPLFCFPSPLPENERDSELGGFEEELNRLLVLLTPEMRQKVESHSELNDLIEIVMDLGRRPIARFPSGDFVLSDLPISFQYLHYATSQVGEFGGDNRAGISRTLHRISAIRNRKGAIIGLTCRVGRAITGSANLLWDLAKDGESILLIGPPGVGKTTMIREIARLLADDYKKRVMIVDTSNEIGGDGDIPHTGIGSARRLQVPDSNMQHKVLIEAVENHMPQVIVIDEIGTKLEAIAACTIAQRGIQLVATAHGITIENLIMNPSLEMLVGGIQSVTLGDGEANRRGVQKTVLERKGPSTFTSGVEIVSKTEVRVHRSLEATIDALLAGRSPSFEIRQMSPKDTNNEVSIVQSGSLHDSDVQSEDETNLEDHLVKNDVGMRENLHLPEFARDVSERSCSDMDIMHMYVYGISETTVLQVIKQLGKDLTIQLTDNISEADAFLALHSRLKKNSHIQTVAESHNIPVHVTKTTSLLQITKAVRTLLKEHASGCKGYASMEKLLSTEKLDALEETRLAIEQVVIPKGESVQLLPRPSYIIDAQIELIAKYRLKWEKVTRETDICLYILPFHVDGTSQSSSFSENVSPSTDVDESTNGVARLPILPE